MATLTRDSMRADVARVLRMAPDELEDEDNLIDLGLDSLRAMSLLTRWSEAGAELDLGEVAEKATLAAWWSLAERALGRHDG